MTTVSHTLGNGANGSLPYASQKPKRGREADNGVSRSAPRSIAEIIGAIARSRWPVKTASNLAMRAERTQRQAEALLAGGGLSADALANLLASDIGLEIIATWVGEVNPSLAWYRDFKRGVTRSELRRKARELTQLIEANEADE